MRNFSKQGLQPIILDIFKYLVENSPYTVIFRDYDKLNVVDEKFIKMTNQMQRYPSPNGEIKGVTATFKLNDDAKLKISWQTWYGWKNGIYGRVPDKYFVDITLINTIDDGNFGIKHYLNRYMPNTRLNYGDTDVDCDPYALKQAIEDAGQTMASNIENSTQYGIKISKMLDLFYKP